MPLATDILIDESLDLVFANGDFLIGASDNQHLFLITIMDLGHLKENPFLGIGINAYLGGSESPNVIKSIAQQMYEADNYAVNNINVKGNMILNVDCTRL